MADFRSIRWRLTLSYLVVLLSIPMLGLYLSHWTEDCFTSSLRDELRTEARFVGQLSEPLLLSGGRGVDAFSKRSGKALGRRVTIVAADGRVLGDSHHDITTMESHRDRPEILQAFSDGSGWSIRESKTLGSRMLYVAVRFKVGADSYGFARLSENLSRVDLVRHRIGAVFFLGAMIVFVIAVIVGIMVSTDVTHPVLAMSAAARRFAKGDLAVKLNAPTVPRDEIDELAIALNKMAGELSGMMDELTSERNKLQTIINKVDDGLIVTDHESRVQMANPAAVRLLDSSIAHILGQTVIESTLCHDLAELVSRVLRTGAPASLEVELPGVQPAYLTAYVAPLDRRGSLVGAIIVMHDLTSAKKMDDVRRDFVANVSHELRTPLASVKAMAETIVLRSQKDPKIAVDFAEKIVTQADRLTAISEDLLDLARIEEGRGVIGSERVCLREVAGHVLSQLQARADYRSIGLGLDMQDSLYVSADPDAVTQILINLVDNGIKYTPHGGSVSVSASVEGPDVVVSVDDTGIGIPSADLSRIFERFYRVDKARSRESGGTGLGLSIVKHLVEAHHGKITVRSTPDAGSSFSFTLPAG